MNDVKEEIKERLAVEDVVGQYVELKRAGRNLKGRSPWGVDKTPSFMVSPEKGIWHDFSANKGGDIFSFVMEVEGITFREALEKLAAQAGVELKKYSGGDAKVAERKKRASEALELATKYYQFCLSRNKKVCEYVFYQRNLNRQTVKDFRIGYAPATGKALIEFLQKKGFKLEELEAAGLLNRFKTDLFRGRMMVPFIDTNGVIGFTARVLDKSEPKYLNTPETLLFNKSRFVFGLAQAKEAIRQNDFVVIVEGNMDVISSHQAGVREAVATSGTAMTEKHLKTLSRLTNDIRLAYDSDEAGVKATERAIMLAGDMGINLSVISGYGDAKDPDELIQKDPKLWQEVVKNKIPAVEWLLKEYEQRLDIGSGDGKREYSNVAMRVIGYIGDAVERKHYEQLVAERLDVTVDDLLSKKVDEKKRRFLKKAKSNTRSDQMKALEDNLLALVVYGGVDVKGVELPEDETKLAELELIFTKEYEDWEREALTKEAEELNKRLADYEKKMKVVELREQLKEAEGDEELTDKILREITKIQKS